MMQSRYLQPSGLAATPMMPTVGAVSQFPSQGMSLTLQAGPYPVAPLSAGSYPESTFQAVPQQAATASSVSTTSVSATSATSAGAAASQNSVSFIYYFFIIFMLLLAESLSLIECKQVLVQVLLSGPSVSQSVWWIVGRWLIQHGCCLGCWVGCVQG